MKSITKSFLAMALMTVFVLFGLQLQTAEAAAIKTTTDVDKAWTIHFAQQVDATTVDKESIYVKNASGQIVETTLEVQHKTVIVSPKASYDYGTYTIYVEPTILSTSKKSIAREMTLPFKVEESTTFTDDVVFTEAGTFGGHTYAADVEIQQAGTTLENATIEGDLIIAASVGEGDVYLKNVTVKGETKILGGGANSVYFKDTTLAKVIINKDNGTIRVVVEGNTIVGQVSLESHAILQEQNLRAEGFTEVLVQERVANQDGQVELKGSFTKVQNFATDLDLNLATDTQLSELILSALTAVTGDAQINNLQVAMSGGGSTLEKLPENVVLQDNTTITVGDTVISENISDATATEIKSIDVNPAFTQIYFTEQMYNLTLEDFNVKVSTDEGTPITLENLAYDNTTGMLTYDLPAQFIHSYLIVEIAAASTSTKLSGSAYNEIYASPGVFGRVTDIYGVGVPHASLLAEEDGIQSVTNASGYYFLRMYNEEASKTVTIKVSAPGYADGTIYAQLSNDSHLQQNDLTLIRAAASDEWKIRLTWNGEESDVDSHLASENFHVYYGDSQYVKDGYEYVDLDWDDTYYYGPETTTIREFEDGRYIFFVHNFSGQNPLEVSESRVELFKGTSTVADIVYNVPSQTNGGDYWGVFELLVSNDGQTIDVVELNTMTYDENILIAPKKYLQQYINELDMNIQHLDGFTNALNAAKATLALSDATTSQLIEAYNALATTVISPDTFTSGYNKITLTSYDRVGMLYPKQFDVKFNIEPYDFSSGSFDEYSLMPGDQIEVSAYMYLYDDMDDSSDGIVQIRNKNSGKVYELSESEEAIVLEQSVTYEQLQALDGTEFEVLTNRAGHLEISLSFKVNNRVVDEGDYESTPYDYVNFYGRIE